MLRLAILDDDERIGIQLKQMILSIDKTIDVETFSDWKMLHLYFTRHAHIDAVFMDLQFSNCTKNGIDYAEKIVNSHSETKIIYITGFPLDYVEKVFMSNIATPFGYIKKPFQSELLKQYINRLSVDCTHNCDLFAFKVVGNQIEFLSLPDVLYFSSEKRYVTAHTAVSSFTGYYKLSELKEILPPYFYMCHKSFLININKIQRIELKHVVICGIQIPISSINHSTISDKRQEMVLLKNSLYEHEKE